MPYKKKAPVKRTKKAVGGALSAAQKRLLGQAQAGAVKKGAGAITKQIVNYTRKHGDQRKAAAAPAKRKPPTSSASRVMKQLTPAQIKALRAKAQTAKRKAPTQKRGGLAMSKAARANLMRMQREAFKTGKNNPKLAALTKKYGMLVKRGDAQKLAQSQVNKRRAGGKMPRIMSTVTGARKAKELAAKRRGSSTTRRPAVGSLKQRITSRSGTVAQRRARALAARRRAAAAARRGRPANTGPTRRIPRKPGTRGRMTPAQRRARLLAARRRMAAMRRRTPSRRRVPTRRAPTTRRGRSAVSPRQRRMFGGLLTRIRKASKRTTSNPMRAKLTGVKRAVARTGNPMANRFKKRGILGKTRTAIGKKRAAGTKVSKSAYKGRGLFGSLKRQAKRTSRPRGVFGRMFGGTMRPTSGGIRRVGGRLTMGKAMTAPKRMVKSSVSPKIIKVPKTKYGAPKGTDPYAKAMNKAMKM